MLGGALGATALLFHQELLESAGGEGESLPPQLHKVAVSMQASCVAASASSGWWKIGRTLAKLHIQQCWLRRHLKPKGVSDLRKPVVEQMSIRLGEHEERHNDDV